MNQGKLPLHAICPYFAMFPEDFVRKQVSKYSNEGDWVFDPFCGRGTTVLESLLLGRNAVGCDINPVAFCVSRGKVERPLLEQVVYRISELERRYSRRCHTRLKDEAKSLPPFFRRAFFHSTLTELLFLRKELDWRQDSTDRFIAALILGSLHGEVNRSGSYFSNQMPRTICLKPDYSLRYWKSNGLFPKKRKVFQMLRDKAVYRLEDIPDYRTGRVELIDARDAGTRFRDLERQISLVVTSPPYLNVTRYEEDQWLRLWFLGGAPNPTYGCVSKDDRYDSVKRYWRFLSEVWKGIASLLAPSAILVIRLGGIGIAEKEMNSRLGESIRNVFPKCRLLEPLKKSILQRRQTQSFLPTSRGCRFEIDYVFRV